MAANSTASSWNIGLRAPQYCGIIERVIGTAMSMVHELPGPTFSNPVERGAYDPQATSTADAPPPPPDTDRAHDDGGSSVALFDDIEEW
ncbi:hypothetical protein ACFWPA_00335 [Rhodococcus sp. NPDC058505]|uniref:hypothetical protein n=1 Tax=Rhodococcus sp. NPDC058505 TaxID=3346531 RepID=UPI003653CA9B